MLILGRGKFLCSLLRIVHLPWPLWTRRYVTGSEKFIRSRQQLRALLVERRVAPKIGELTIICAARSLMLANPR